MNCKPAFWVLLLGIFALPASRAGLLLEGPRSFYGGTNPVAMAVADCNHDKRMDIAIANQGFVNGYYPWFDSGRSIAVLLGRSDDQLETPLQLAPGGMPHTIAFADLNGDGNPDLVVGLLEPGLEIFFGKGNGTFEVPSTVINLAAFTAAGPAVIAVLDLNGDEQQDVVAAVNDRLILLSREADGATNRNPSFAIETISMQGLRPASIAAGDFNGDGRMDLAISDGDFYGIEILLSNGKGGFDSRRSISVMAKWKKLVAADFNHDGKLDLAATEGEANGKVGVFFGRGNGDFDVVSEYPVRLRPGSITAISGKDGVVNLVVANEESTSLSFLPGSLDGTFGPARNVPGAIGDLAAADIDGDGSLDLISLTTRTPGSRALASVAVHRGLVTGLPQIAPNYYCATTPNSIAIGDLNSDGKLDLVVNGTSPSVLAVLLGDGAGAFRHVTSLEGGKNQIVLGDFDQDGKQDVAGILFYQGELEILSFTQQQTIESKYLYKLGGFPFSVQTADLNSDGKLDLILGNTGGQEIHSDIQASLTNSYIQILLGKGDDSFGPATNLFSGFAAQSFTVADVNSDSKPDLLFTSFGRYDPTNRAYLNQGFYVCLGNGVGGFLAPVLHPFRGEATALFCADLNRDGSTDVIARISPWLDKAAGSMQPGGFIVFLGDPAVTFQRSIAVIGEPDWGAPSSALDFDGDGNIDLAGIGDVGVWIRLGNGDGSFSSPIHYFHAYGRSFATGDLNGDGMPDLVVPNQSYYFPGSSVVSDGGAMVLLNKSTPQLVLHGERLNNVFKLSWPVGSAASLESSSDLLSRVWALKPGLLTTNGRSIQMEVLLASTNEFFRLGAH